MFIEFKMDINSVMLAIKIFVFAFIITSPFYNVGEVFFFLNNVYFKIILLLITVSVSFIDLQLAIIMAIAFFIIVINFNNTKPNIKVKPIDVIPHSPAVSVEPLPSSIAYEVPSVQAQPYEIEAAAKDDDNIMQTMYEFPKAECNVPKEANDAYVNDSISGYYLDDKIKPYEEFISQLTSKELLDSVSNGAYQLN